MTSSMFAPLDAEAVSGGDPRNLASSAAGQQHQNRVGGGVLAVDSLIAATGDGLASNASAEASSLSRYEAECTTGLVLSSSVHHQPRSRLQHHHHQQNNSQSTNGLSKRRQQQDEDNYSQRLGVNSSSPYAATANADMQPATQFYLNFNPAFAHHGQFGPTSFTPPYMPHYPIPSSLTPPNSYQLHHHHQQQQQQQLQTNR